MRYLKEFAAEWNRIGETRFKHHYEKPALIGLGMLGELLDRKRPPQRRTVLTMAPADQPLIETEILRDRVWLIMNTDTGRRSIGVTFGRGSENDLIIPEYSISDQHGEIRFDLGQILIVDLGSLNGTLVNGRLLKAGEPIPLKDGDKVTLGRFQFMFLTAPRFVERVSAFASR